VTARRVRTTRELSPSEAPKYLSKAREFLEAALFSLELGTTPPPRATPCTLDECWRCDLVCLVGSVSKGSMLTRQSISTRSEMYKEALSSPAPAAQDAGRI